ncbi:UDP-N-acetylmuramoylalanyl-D-glutamyl-2, 6-diaminopimelate--D-alanyl-D-alanine ligase [Lysobacteraceae bacterium NML75-0749]|nr:UDP-N-acetylmuramoylalanyl-D-glutamyl-2, 6-diaminopimelate--D-alanyl-D-alanine ligase [Xanthomonadaceae bacterium NML75-0749]PJK06018.1 UDP-N-acetylmuramoylalanyl-D-glutamyl-2, 6-diaminopimelate--D-alanyl-D-alanine ligase [Xanthomonadaceae bacterium NML91-0268]
MKPMTLAQIAELTQGRVVGDAARQVDVIATDSRKLPSGQVLFVALKGEHFDGHDHVQQAAAAGACAALVSRELPLSLPQVVVQDTQAALADIARGLHRARRLKAFAITGSNGKTSVKTLLAAILQRAGRTHATPGNLNNEIGLPLTVIGTPEDSQYAVYEMGAGQPGDIAWLTAVAAPDVALVNNIAPAHLERMGSLLGIADTKAAIYDDLREGGTAVINADDAFAEYFAARAGNHKVLRFGLEASADVRADNIRSDAEGSQFRLLCPQGEADIRLALAGRHNIANALAAASMALAAGLSLADIKAGIESVVPVAGRLAAQRLASGAWLIDDSYNANPGSLGAAIDTLAAAGGETWLVLGDMRELGADAARLHTEAGARARAAGIQRLYALGALSAEAAKAFGEGAQVFDSHQALATALQNDMRADVRVLVKGSRGSAMDRVVTLLQGEHTDAA